MNVDQELLNYGLEAEEVVLNYFTSFGLDATQNRVNPVIQNTIINNLRYGDISIYINDKFRLLFDVKRGLFISETSIRRFGGGFFIMFPSGNISDVGAARVVKSSTIKSYFNKVPQKFIQNGKSGQRGYRFSKLKNYVLLDDFVSNIIKRIIILDNGLSENGESSLWGEYLKTFNKVYPEGVKPRWNIFLVEGSQD